MLVERASRVGVGGTLATEELSVSACKWHPGTNASRNRAATIQVRSHQLDSHSPKTNHLTAEKCLSDP